MPFARRAFAFVAPLVVPSLLAAQTYPSKTSTSTGSATT